MLSASNTQGEELTKQHECMACYNTAGAKLTPSLNSRSYRKAKGSWFLVIQLPDTKLQGVVCVQE